jgi:hypothetical protein
MKNIVWVSLGENCLPQTIINDLGLNSIVSPYSWAIGTIDHILNMQEKDFSLDDYRQFVDTVYNETYSIHKTSKNSNDYWFKNGQEFLIFRHHDFSKQKDYEEIARRFARYKALNDKNLVFLYHYRITENSQNAKQVRSRLEHFISKYYPKAKAVMFYKTEANDGTINLIDKKNNVFEFEIKTTTPYEGVNPAWKASGDRKLHKKMIKSVLQYLSKEGYFLR